MLVNRYTNNISSINFYFILLIALYLLIVADKKMLIDKIYLTNILI